MIRVCAQGPKHPYYSAMNAAKGGMCAGPMLPSLLACALSLGALIGLRVGKGDPDIARAGSTLASFGSYGFGSNASQSMLRHYTSFMNEACGIEPTYPSGYNGLGASQRGEVSKCVAKALETFKGEDYSNFDVLYPTSSNVAGAISSCVCVPPPRCLKELLMPSGVGSYWSARITKECPSFGGNISSQSFRVLLQEGASFIDAVLEEISARVPEEVGMSLDTASPNTPKRNRRSPASSTARPWMAPVQDLLLSCAGNSIDMGAFGGSNFIRVERSPSYYINVQAGMVSYLRRVDYAPTDVGLGPA